MLRHEGRANSRNTDQMLPTSGQLRSNSHNSGRIPAEFGRIPAEFGRLPAEFELHAPKFGTVSTQIGHFCRGSANFADLGRCWTELGQFVQLGPTSANSGPPERERGGGGGDVVGGSGPREVVDGSIGPLAAHYVGFTRFHKIWRLQSYSGFPGMVGLDNACVPVPENLVSLENGAHPGTRAVPFLRMQADLSPNRADFVRDHSTLVESRSDLAEMGPTATEFDRIRATCRRLRASLSRNWQI